MANHQIACIPTLGRRCFRNGEAKEASLFSHDTPPPGADTVIVDEAHIGVGGEAQKIIEHYKKSGALVLGLTATPARRDGRGLGAIYDDMVQGPTVRELTEQGHLVPARYFAGEKPDVSDIKTQAGDYHQKQLGARVDEPKLVGDIVSNWCRLASDRQTFVFAVNVAHSRHLCERFKEVGVKAEHLDGTTEHDERKAIHDRLHSGETQVICNCQVYTYGVDFPPVSCIVLATPTKSITKYFQMVGRGLRTHPGKADCMVLDHAGAIQEIGFIDDDMPWTLDGKKKIQDKKKESKEIEVQYIDCPACEAVFRAAKHCPRCGHEMGSKYKKAIDVYEAELVEVRKNEKKRNVRLWSMNDKIQFFAELKGQCSIKGYKEGWAAYKYRERLGVWPNDKRIKNAQMKQPSAETLAWLKHIQIRDAKRKKKETQREQSMMAG